MGEREHFLIAGASLAGLRGAEALRASGYRGHISIVGEEARMPYNRPPLSKKILTGEQAILDVHFPVAEDLDVDWILGKRATGLDVARRQVALDSGESVSFDKLLIATGVYPIRPSIPGRDLEGVHALRHFEDAERLRADMERHKSIVIMGAGFIGCEVAASARHLGLDVAIIDRLAWPMNRVMNEEMGTLFRDIHEERGVRFLMGRNVECLTGDKRVTGVVLDGGETIEADIVLVGVGSAPAVRWLEASGLVLRNGVLCESTCLAVNGNGCIAAAGDVASWPHLGFNGEVMRIEHWTNAFEQGASAALALVAEEPEAYLPLPSFWSDQYGYKIQALGRPRPTDEARVAAGSLESRKFIVEFQGDEGLSGVLSVNMPARIAGYRRDLGTAITERALAR